MAVPGPEMTLSSPLQLRLIKLGCNTNIDQQGAYHPPTGSSLFISDRLGFLTFTLEEGK